MCGYFQIAEIEHSMCFNNCDVIKYKLVYVIKPVTSGPLHNKTIVLFCVKEEKQENFYNAQLHQND